MKEQEKLHQKLLEDSGSAETAELLTLQFNQWPAPKATKAATAQLLQTLQPAWETAVSAAPRPLPERLQWVYWLLRSQAQVVRGELWVGSFFVMALGVVVTLVANRGGLPFVLIAPLVAAAGVSFLYGPGVDPALEIEMATAVSPRTILLARLLLLFGIDLTMGVAGSLLLSLFLSDLSLWSLILGWLAPMTFLSALALFLSLLFFEPLLGILVSLVLWGVQTLHQPSFGFNLPVYIPNLLGATMQPWLWAFAGLFVVAAMWLAGQEERMVGSIRH